MSSLVLNVEPREVVAIVAGREVRVGFIQGARTGEANTAANVGGAAEVFRDKTLAVLNFRTLLGIGNISVAVNGDVVEIDGSALALDADLDAHVADLANPHATSIANLGAGTLAQLNAAVTDATLDDAGDSRPPTGAASGQLGGTYPGPDVRGLRETGGPTLLSYGSIPDTFLLGRSGTDVVGVDPASVGTTDHGALAGLGDDDHTQYLLVDGTRAMSGALDLGTNAIVNVSLVDGVDISAHASRHENGGADEISVAGLSGLLADAQTPLAHASTHSQGGSDEIDAADLGSGAAGANTVLTADGVGGAAWVFNATTDELVGVTASDTTPGYLDDKLVAGNAIALTVLNPAADEDLQIAVDESAIDHVNLQSIGTNSHAAIDAHIADATIHFTEASIDHTAIQNIGTNTHAQIDTHIADATIHFTEASIDHTAIQNIGTNSHAAIDAHIASVANPHQVTITQAYDQGGGLVTLNATDGALLLNGAALAAGTAGLVGPDYLTVQRSGLDIATVAYNATDGRATLYSGATGGLEFAPDPSGGATSPILGILTNKLDIFRGTRTFSGTGPASPLEWNGTFNMGFSSGNSVGGFLSMNGTFNFTSSANPFGMGNALLMAATWKNANGVSANLGPCFLFVNNGVFQADGASISMSQMRTFFDNPTYNTINGGTLTMAAAIGHVGLYSQLTVNSGATVGLRRGHAFFDATGTGTLTEQVALDIANLTFATTNTGIRSAMNTPGTFISHTGTAAARFGGEVEIDGALNHDGSTAGFFGVAPVARPTVTGSRGGNAALADLLTDLQSLGLIIDSTSA